jgi:hypothetical protein
METPTANLVFIGVILPESNNNLVMIQIENVLAYKINLPKVSSKPTSASVNKVWMLS